VLTVATVAVTPNFH